jgi:ferredoxin
MAIRPGSPKAPAAFPTRTELVVDRIACDGFGMCAELLPELIDLDDWGYPIVRAGGVPGELIDHARRAVNVCPVLALRLERRATAPVERGQAGWLGPAAGPGSGARVRP